jgi:hypothetical protein
MVICEKELTHPTFTLRCALELVREIHSLSNEQLMLCMHMAFIDLVETDTSEEQKD